MYDELVKRLRNIARSDGNIKSNYIGLSLLQAADAIELLQKTLQVLSKKENTNASEYARQNHHLPHGSLEPHITNADRIRSMTDEELASWISGRKETCPPIKVFKCSAMSCHECWLGWLRKEAET